MTVSQNGTNGRVYGGDSELVHVDDGRRADAGRAMAEILDEEMRWKAFKTGARTREQSMTQALCPGCYMIVGFNMLLSLAQSNGQDVRELGRTMAAAFAKLAECGDTAECIEEINVIVDPD